MNGSGNPGRGVILVRHAMPEVIPGVASTLWGLSQRAKEDCVLLAHALPANLASPVISSGQPKVDETAAVIAVRRGVQMAIDSRVREVVQPPEWYEGNYRDLAAAYLSGNAPGGWEPQASVVRRFTAAVRQAMAAPGDDHLVIVNHGLALSLYLASLGPGVIDAGNWRPFDLLAYWRALTFPDAWHLDPASNTVTRVFTAGLPPRDD